MSENIKNTPPAFPEIDLPAEQPNDPIAEALPLTTAAAPSAEAPAEPIAAPAAPVIKNTTQTAEVFSPLAGPWDDAALRLNLPAGARSTIMEALNKAPNVKMDDTLAGKQWADILESGSDLQPANDMFSKTVQRESADFQQVVNSETGPLQPATPRFHENVGAKLTGERAVLRVKALLGLGSIVQIPLWHSGFWLTLKAPAEAELLELNRRIIEEKISLGRSTYGLAFANHSVFFVNHVLDLAISHLYDTTLKDTTELRGKIASPDIPIIAWGLACTIWTNGFPYARSVMGDEKDPNKVIREKLNLGKLLWIDNAAFTPWQVSHMAKRQPNTMTNEMVQRYRDEFVAGQERVVQLSDNFKVSLKVPSALEYMESGQKWVNGIVTMVDKAFGLAPNENARNSYILEQGKATNMRQYAHWVKALHAGDNIIEDVETIEDALSEISSDDAIRDKYFEGIQAFIEDATIALIAVPTANDADEEHTLPRYPHLLPLDALITFFTLLVQKVVKIQAR